MIQDTQKKEVNVFIRLATVVSVALSASAVSAVSVSWNLEGSALVQVTPLKQDQDEAKSENPVVQELDDNNTKRLSVGVGTSGPGSGGGTAYYSINKRTGEIGFGASAIVQGAARADRSRGNGDGQAGSSVNFTLFETYTISGAGDLTFDMHLTGLFEGLSEPDRGANVSVSASIGLYQPPRLGSLALVTFRDNVNQNAVDTIRGIDEMLSFTVSNPDPGLYQLQVGLSAGASVFSKKGALVASGDADFGSTAFLSLTTTGDLTATPSDPEFLSAVGGPVAPIPLPPGFLLLATGLAGLGLMRSRTRAKDEADT